MSKPCKVAFSIVAQGNRVEGVVQLSCASDIERAVARSVAQGIRPFAVLKMECVDPSYQRAHEPSGRALRPAQRDTQLSVTWSLIPVIEMHLSKGSRIVET